VRIIQVNYNKKSYSTENCQKDALVSVVCFMQIRKPSICLYTGKYNGPNL